MSKETGQTPKREIYRCAAHLTHKRGFVRRANKYQKASTTAFCYRVERRKYAKAVWPLPGSYDPTSRHDPTVHASADIRAQHHSYLHFADKDYVCAGIARFAVEPAPIHTLPRRRFVPAARLCVAFDCAPTVQGARAGQAARPARLRRRRSRPAPVAPTPASRPRLPGSGTAAGLKAR